MAVRLLPGIAEVDADFKTRTAQIAYDPNQVAIETIRQALENIGYESTSIEP